MSKMDLVISRDMVLNTGNYSSIRPSVSITLKDVDSKEFLDKYYKMSRVLEYLLLKETLSLGGEQETSQSLGFKKYLNEIEKYDTSNEHINEITDILKEF